MTVMPAEGERATTLRERLFGAGNVRLPESHYGTRYRGGANLHESRIETAPAAV